MKIITSVLILLLSSQFISGQSAVKKIDSICQSISNKNPEIGISIGFVENGKEYFFNYGKISRESNLKADQNTIYEIGSITKFFTANLIVQANNEGKLKIDDFIDDYLPKEYVLSKEIKGKLKISDLASHQSGLPDLDIKKQMELNPKQPLDIGKEAIHSLINENTKLIDYGNYRYSNINFILMGIILEKAYGKDFETLLKEKILVPVKMENTLTTSFDVKNKVTGYDYKGVQQDFFNWNSFVAPAGLLKSNTSDLTKFLKTLLSNKGEISKATILAENTFYKNTQREIGLGLQMERTDKDVYFYKTGNTMACASILAYDKKSNWGIVILLNHNNSGLIADFININYDEVLKKKSFSK
ncbi:beta-lactamase family protein [Flavobacterium sp. ANB]|uniref:serine hydrolase domain-containing protein n=1 Tax=unclassified Flavobacterium TaxID=196869 RepID=UPI0012B6BAF2|nr:MULTISPECIES: serine hydrolase domain-containing protein [unclassified Flavobacterium]MBF4517766.1 beta-lactamase family protein [Flavobacterium sp. ANB]MTD70493.1 serine hydrolase [Flavobacterium sp. LC2016-13]